MISFPSIIIKHWTLAWIANLGISFFFLSSILVLFSISEDLQQYFFLFSNQPLKVFQIILLPYLPWIVPICCFTATILTFYIFENSLEWSSVKACAVSPYWISGSILVLGIFVSLSLAITTISGSPSANPLIKNNQSGFAMKIGKESSWYFQSFNVKSMEGENLQVYLYDENGDDALRIRSSKAHWNRSQGWTFYNGVYLSFLTNRGLPVPNHQKGEIDWLQAKDELFFVEKDSKKTPLRKLKFSILQLDEFKENPMPHLLARENPKNLSFQNLKQVLDEYPEPNSKVLAPFRFRYAQVSLNLGSCAFATMVALLLVATTERIKLSASLSIILCGIVIFYISSRFANSIGTRGIVDEWFVASVPYFSVVFVWFLLRTRKLFV